LVVVSFGKVIGRLGMPVSTATTAGAAAGGGVMQYREGMVRHQLSTIIVDKDIMEILNGKIKTGHLRTKMACFAADRSRDLC